LACGRLSFARLDHIPHNHFFDLFGIYARTLHRSFNGNRSQLRGGHAA
jgi:hypothetical protein